MSASRAEINADEQAITATHSMGFGPFPAPQTGESPALLSPATIPDGQPTDHCGVVGARLACYH